MTPEQKILKTIERICPRCGHDRTCDGCAFCMRVAIAKLSELTPERITYFQADTTKDPEAAKRWFNLNAALFT